MPGRGGRVGGGRGGGFRAPRVSSGGSKGGRVSIGSRAPRVTTSAPITNASAPQHVHHHRPWFRSSLPGAWGTGWRFVGILITLIVFGICACVALAVALQAFGFGA